jgi:putative endonuclease
MKSNNYTVYVLYSENYNKIYIGRTADIQSRFKSHNELSGKGWTKNFRPWKIVYQENYNELKDASKREKELKSSRGRDFIWNLIKEI